MLRILYKLVHHCLCALSQSAMARQQQVFCQLNALDSSQGGSRPKTHSRNGIMALIHNIVFFPGRSGQQAGLTGAA